MPDTAAALSIELMASFKEFEKQMKAATGVFDREGRKIEKRQADLKKRLETGFGAFGKQLAGAASIVGIGLGTREIVEYADKWNEAKNALRAVIPDADRVGSVMERIYQIAQRNGQAVNPLTGIYQKLMFSQQALGVTSDQLMQFLSMLSTGLKVSGLSAEQAQGGIDQLLRSFETGEMDSRGFRSILTQMPALAAAAARGMDSAGGSVVKLTEMVKDGHVSARDFFDAVLKGGGSLREAAARDIDPVSEAMTRLENAFERYVGNVSETVGASTTLAGGIDFLAEHIDDVVKAAGMLAAVLGGAAVGVGLTAALETATIGFGALAAAILANPLAIVVTVIAGLTAAVLLYSEKVPDAKKAVDQEREAHEKLNKVLADAKTKHEKLPESLAKEEMARLKVTEATLKQAEAQALVNLQNAKSRAEVNANGGSYGALSPLAVPATSFGDQRSVADYEREHRDIVAAQRRNAADQARLAKTPTKPDKPGKPQVPTNDKEVALAQRRDQILADTDARAKAAQADLVRAQSEANEQMSRGSDAYYAAARARIDADAIAEIAAIESKRDAELTSLAKMEKGWKDYEAAKANIQAEAKAKTDAVTAKRNEQLSAPAADLAEQTRELRDHIATMGMTDSAAQRYLITQRANAQAAALETAGHHQEAQALRDNLAAYIEASKASEEAARNTQDNIEASDQLRDGLANAFGEGVHGAKNFKDALAQTLEQLAVLIARMAAMKYLIEPIFGEKGTPIGATAGSPGNTAGGFDIFGLKSGNGGNQPGGFDLLGSLSSLIPSFDVGTNSAPGGLAKVHKDEIINLPRHASVTPAIPAIRALHAVSGGGGSASISIGGNSISVAGNADNSTVAAMAMMLDAHKRDLPSMIAAELTRMKLLRKGVYGVGK